MRSLCECKSQILLQKAYPTEPCLPCQESISSVSSEIDDITKVDEKILEYYDKVVNDDEENGYPEEPENIGTEIKSGWRLIKEELNSPIESVVNDNDVDLVENLTCIKQEINLVLNNINELMDKIKK